ncbi:MAG: hypothetical protein HOO92_10960 [Methylococcaceae bacterium]|nr:hypothetical protein [Methylococcaceae bacterium]
MKRMTTSKMNSQAGYLQAHFECEKIVLARKLIAMDLEKDTIYEPQNVLDENEYCWEKIRSFYSKNHSENPRKLFIPQKLADIDTDTVKEIREEIAEIFNIDKGIDCGVNGLKRIKPALGVEINRRMKKK